VGVESGHHKMAREVPNDEEEHFQLGTEPQQKNELDRWYLDTR